MTWKPQILTRNGKPEYAVLPYNQFEKMQEQLEDAADLIALDRARREDAGKPNISFDNMMRQLGLRSRKPKRKSSRAVARKRKR